MDVEKKMLILRKQHGSTVSWYQVAIPLISGTRWDVREEMVIAQCQKAAVTWRPRASPHNVDESSHSLTPGQKMRHRCCLHYFCAVVSVSVSVSVTGSRAFVSCLHHLYTARSVGVQHRFQSAATSVVLSSSREHAGSRCSGSENAVSCLQAVLLGRPQLLQHDGLCIWESWWLSVNLFKLLSVSVAVSLDTRPPHVTWWHVKIRRTDSDLKHCF
jgi:hypothetical protein